MFPPIWPVFVALIAGAIGYKYGRSVRNNLSNDNTPNNPSKPSGLKDATAPHTDHNADRKDETNKGFPLGSIKHVFAEHNSPLSSANSFTLLLDVIEKDAYYSLLKDIMKKVHSPADLNTLLNQENLNVVAYECTDSTEGPFISEVELDKIISKSNVDCSKFDTLQDKVIFMLCLAQAKGTKRFLNSSDRDLIKFMELHSKGEDATAFYNSIMSQIQHRIDFIS